MKGVLYFVCLFFLLFGSNAFAQNGKPPVIIPTDSTTQIKNPAFTKDTAITITKKDTIITVPKHDPGKAALRSLVIPGWGQAYNREYWKIPIVYAALGTVAGIYIYNNNWYKKTRDAYTIRINNDTANFDKIDPKLEPISTPSLETIRNSFRRDRDYSMLYFLLFWGLNIVDATVFAHLKQFDVSEDLSLKINPVIKLNGSTGLSLVLGYRTPSKGHVYLK